MDVKAFREYYEFDDDDLYANQQGRLSDKQYQAMARVAVDVQKFSKIGGVVALVAAAFIPCIALPLSLLTIMTKDWTTTIIAWVGSLVWLAIFGGAGVWLLRSARAEGQPKPDNVTRAEGVVQLRQERRNSGGQHSRTYTVTFAVIGDTDFELDDELVGHISAGDHIAAYFARGEVISVEQLPA